MSSLKTPLYKLNVPLQSDTYNVDDFNENMNKLESVIKSVDDKANTALQGTSDHESKRVADFPTGVHGIRYNPNEELLEVLTPDEGWIGVTGGVAGNKPESPNACFSLNVEPKDGKLLLTWRDPLAKDPDPTHGSTWAGTKVIIRNDRYAGSGKDPTLVVDSKVYDAYRNTPLEITGLMNDVTYYITLIPYSITDVENLEAGNRITGVPVAPKVYTVVFTYGSAPSYEDAAFGVAQYDYAFWDGVFEHYPCIVKDGVEVAKLNPNNFKQLDTGQAVNLSSNSLGDYMVCFPKIYMKYEQLSDRSGKFSFCKEQKAGFIPFGFKNGNTEYDKMYVSMFNTKISSGKATSFLDPNGTYDLMSIGSTDNVQSRFDAISAKGAGYFCLGHIQMSFLQIIRACKMGRFGGSVKRGSSNPPEATHNVMDYTDKSGLDFYGYKWLGLYECLGSEGLFVDNLFFKGFETYTYTNNTLTNNYSAPKTRRHNISIRITGYNDITINDLTDNSRMIYNQEAGFSTDFGFYITSISDYTYRSWAISDPCYFGGVKADQSGGYKFHMGLYTRNPSIMNLYNGGFTSMSIDKLNVSRALSANFRFILYK